MAVNLEDLRRRPDPTEFKNRALQGEVHQVIRNKIHAAQRGSCTLPAELLDRGTVTAPLFELRGGEEKEMVVDVNGLELGAVSQVQMQQWSLEVLRDEFGLLEEAGSEGPLQNTNEVGIFRQETVYPSNRDSHLSFRRAIEYRVTEVTDPNNILYAQCGVKWFVTARK